MANLAQKKSDFISSYIVQVTNLLETTKQLLALRTYWDSQGFSTAIVDGDFVGANQHLTAANLQAAVTSVQAVTDLLAANGNAHYTNLYRLPA